MARGHGHHPPTDGIDIAGAGPATHPRQRQGDRLLPPRTASRSGGTGSGHPTRAKEIIDSRAATPEAPPESRADRPGRAIKKLAQPPCPQPGIRPPLDRPREHHHVQPDQLGGVAPKDLAGDTLEMVPFRGFWRHPPANRHTEPRHTGFSRRHNQRDGRGVQAFAGGNKSGKPFATPNTVTRCEALGGRHGAALGLSLDSDALAALRAASVDDGASRRGLHARTKTVGLLSARRGWLKRSFHDFSWPRRTRLP